MNFGKQFYTCEIYDKLENCSSSLMRLFLWANQVKFTLFADWKCDVKHHSGVLTVQVHYVLMYHHW